MGPGAVHIHLILALKLSCQLLRCIVCWSAYCSCGKTQTLQCAHWMKITHFLNSCICLSCLPSVCPPFSCMRVIVNTTTVWKNTVTRATFNRLDIAVSHLLRNAGKQRNKETKPKMLKISHASFQSSMFHRSVSFSLKWHTQFSIWPKGI